MRPRLLWLAAPVAATVAAIFATPSGAVDDRTEPYGPFGFTTVGLGAGASYGEPSLAIAPDGQHYVATTPGGASDNNGTVQVWHSADGGGSWQHTFFTSDNGGGDSEVDIRPDGTVLGADLEVGENNDSEIHTSHDYGATWDQDGVQAGQEQDRQWFAHTPDGSREFLAYHDLVAEGEFFVESDDGGHTWSNPTVVNDPGQVAPPGAAVAPTSGGPASLADQGVNTFSGPMLVDNNGQDFYVVYSISNLESNSTLDGGGVPPFGGVKGIVVAHSSDAGKTWSNRYAVVASPKTSDVAHEEFNGTMFPWGFLDPAGNVYIVYGSTRDAPGTDHYGYYYVYSTDHGTTWSQPTRIDGMGPGVGSVVFNTGGAVDTGLIDVAWLQKDTSGISEDEGTWSPWFAQIAAANTSQPRIYRQRMTTLPNHRNGICIQGTLCLLPAEPGSHDRSLLDFIELAVNPVTHLASVVYADNGGFRPGEGKGEVVFAQQTVQPGWVTGPDHGRGQGPKSQPGGTAGDTAPASLALAAAPVAVWRRRTHRRSL